jgi:hypothetical protein
MKYRIVEDRGGFYIEEYTAKWTFFGVVPKWEALRERETYYHLGMMNDGECWNIHRFATKKQATNHLIEIGG